MERAEVLVAAVISVEWKGYQQDGLLAMLQGACFETEVGNGQVMDHSRIAIDHPELDRLAGLDLKRWIVLAEFHELNNDLDFANLCFQASLVGLRRRGSSLEACDS